MKRQKKQKKGKLTLKRQKKRKKGKLTLKRQKRGEKEKAILKSQKKQNGEKLLMINLIGVSILAKNADKKVSVRTGKTDPVISLV